MPLAAMKDGSQDNQGEEGGGGEGGKEEEREDARPSFPSFSREMNCQDPSTGCCSIRGQECHSSSTREMENLNSSNPLISVSV